MQLLFSIKNQTLYFRSRSIVVADSQGYLTAKFTFSDDWVDVDKYAQFKRGDLYYDIKLDENDECVVPWELLTEEGVFNVNVLGLNKKGNPNKVITVNSVDIIVEASGITKDMDATNPTEGVFGESVRIALRAIDDSKDDALQEIADGTVQALSSTGIWESGEQVKVGDVRYMHGRDYAGYVLECVKAGTTGASQPIVSTEDIDNTTDLEYMSGTLPIAHGGTGATTAEGARSNLGLTYATQSEAEGGSDNTKVMTPLRTKQFGDKNYLPLSGGLLSGGITQIVNGGNCALKKNVDNDFLHLCGGTSQNNGSSLLLFGENFSYSVYGAGFELRTALDNENNYCALRGKRDGTLIWNHTEIFNKSHIASQAQAEAGTDNTTVMTPKGVDYRLQKNRQVSTFSSLEALGLSPSTATPKDIVDALPPNSYLCFYASSNTSGQLAALGLTSSSLVVVESGLNDTIPASFRAYPLLNNQNNFFYIGHYKSLNNLGFTGWKKIATQGALSMPSGNVINVSAGTTSFDAPADGWLGIRATANTDDSAIDITASGVPLGRFVAPANGYSVVTVYPCRKGQTYTISYSGCTGIDSYFYYAQSEV